MSREDVSFKTGDGTVLRGWFYPATSSINEKAPCLILSHGFSAIKEMVLDEVAEALQKALPSLAVLVYDHRGFGASDTGHNQIRSEIVPAEQIVDMQDAITYVQMRPEVDPEKIGIWGSSYSGGHVLSVGAIDRRVKAVVSQVPHVDGLQVGRRLVRADIPLDAMFQADRHARAGGKEPAFNPVVSTDPSQPGALPTKDAYDWFIAQADRTKGWENKVTVRTLELVRAYRPGLMIDAISPTPLLMIVAVADTLTPADMCLEAYNRAREPKELLMLEGGHFDVYAGDNMGKSINKQVDFLKRTLLA